MRDAPAPQRFGALANEPARRRGRDKIAIRRRSPLGNEPAQRRNLSLQRGNTLSGAGGGAAHGRFLNSLYSLAMQPDIFEILNIFKYRRGAAPALF